MNRAEFVALLGRMAEGWRSGDAALVAGCFAEELWYGDPTRYVFTSREALQPFFEPPPAGHWTVWHRIIFDEDQQTGAAEYTYQGHNRYHGAVVVTVAGGLVTHWREWQHISEASWESFVNPPAK